MFSKGKKVYSDQHGVGEVVENGGLGFHAAIVLFEGGYKSAYTSDGYSHWGPSGNYGDKIKILEEKDVEEPGPTNLDQSEPPSQIEQTLKMQIKALKEEVQDLTVENRQMSDELDNVKGRIEYFENALKDHSVTNLGLIKAIAALGQKVKIGDL